MEKNKKCLVTGGAGFIGSHLCDALVDKGYEVVCIDNLITGSIRNIRHLQKSSKFKFIKHDIIHPFSKNLTQELKNISQVYHLASPASPPKYRKFSIETMLVNSIGTFHILELARQTKATFLFTSTSEIYGEPQVHPQLESYFGNCNTLGPRACYDEGKRFSEAFTMEYFRRFNLDVRIVRIFNTYGPRMEKDDGRVISNFVNAAISQKPLFVYGDGTQTRSFCYISDMVRGILLMAEKKNIEKRVINLGYPKERSINEIARIVLKLTNSPSKIVKKDKMEDDPTRRRPDITRAQKILNWSPKVNLEKGLKEAIHYFQSL